MKAKRSNRTNQKGIDAVPAHVAQSVEHVLGKDEVTGSSPVVSSIPAESREEESSRTEGPRAARHQDDGPAAPARRERCPRRSSSAASRT